MTNRSQSPVLLLNVCYMERILYFRVTWKKKVWCSTMYKALRTHAWCVNLLSYKAVTVSIAVLFDLVKKLLFKYIHIPVIFYFSDIKVMFLTMPFFRIVDSQTIDDDKVSVLVCFWCRPYVVSKVTASLNKFVVAIIPKAKENFRMSTLLRYITLLIYR
jgi:hypothetical protein